MILDSDILVTLPQIVMLLFVIARTARLVGRERRNMIALFFLFACASILASDFYWIAYDLLRPGTRMPFAGNEFGEWASFLLLASALETVFRGKIGNARKEIIGAALFSAVSVVLWIAWSGEWVQDILCGLALGYLLCTSARSLVAAGVLSPREWGVVGITAALLAGMEIATLLTAGAVKQNIDLTCYALMVVSIALTLVKTGQTAKSGDAPDKLLALTFGGFAWVVSCLYMSEGIFYLIALAASVILLPLMLVAVQREVDAA